MTPESLHEQATIKLRYGTAKVDAKMARILEHLDRLKFKTYESCENYGEFLRQYDDLSHVIDYNRNYAYIEFYDIQSAMKFITMINDVVALTSPLFFKTCHGGTPGAWEVKVNLASAKPDYRAWVWFPSEDIPELEQVLSEVEAE